MVLKLCSTEEINLKVRQRMKLPKSSVHFLRHTPLPLPLPTKSGTVSKNPRLKCTSLFKNAAHKEGYGIENPEIKVHLAVQE